MSRLLSAVVAGHICLDIIPDLQHLGSGQFDKLFQPGHLVEIGPAMLSTGGPVANTGLALHRLGIPTRLIAKVGADAFGEAIKGIVHSFEPSLMERLVTDVHAGTSYSIIISHPSFDRFFLHHTGANDTFTSTDIRYDVVDNAHLFHFGYPPVMRLMYQASGEELVKMLRRVKGLGLTTSLDMTFPDPAGEAGRADWENILSATLPWVDIFMPSLEEILFMLHRKVYDELAAQANGGEILPHATPELVSDLGQEALAKGARIAAIKLGERGLYVRTAGQDILSGLGRACPTGISAWADRELWAPCFKVKVAGTTGAGGATIAGFLSAILRDFPPETAIAAAVAVGACCVEAPDALRGILGWEATLKRIAAGWERQSWERVAPGWRFDPEKQLGIGPADRER